MLIDIIAGARPNFMKIAPIIDAIKIKQKEGANIRYRLVHTGQHFDKKMSGEFFKQLNIPEPDINLGAGGGSQAEQTAAIMVKYEKVLMNTRPDLVLVVGDVTSTMACSITAKKLNNIKIAHVEAGIRSGDWTMPEEINRLVTDAITDYFFTTTTTANQNLLNAGKQKDQIFFVGNTMIDTLLKQIPNLKKPHFWDSLKLVEKNYIVITLHRPSNVDDTERFKDLIDTIINESRDIDLIFPVHPRTAKTLQQIVLNNHRLHTVEPLGYLEFNYLVKYAKAVITDSGGITEEATVMGIPCMTLRSTTERPETCTIGTNELLGTDIGNIKPALEKLFNNQWKKGGIPDLWDGNAAKRIVDQILSVH